MLTRRFLMSATAAGAALLHAADAAYAASPSNIIVVGKRIDDLISLDPQECFEFTGSELCGNIYQGLVTSPNSDPNKLEGDLAERWEVSADGKTYTFHLRQGPKFASGKPVTAEDVVFSLSRGVLLNKPCAFILKQFGLTAENVAQDITAPDARTVVIKLPETFAPSFVLYCLSSTIGGVVEKAVAMANQKDGDLGNAWLKTNSAGSGLLTLYSWRASESVMLGINPHQIGAAPSWTRMVIRHMPEAATQLLAVQQGDIDIARDLGPDQLRAIASDSTLKPQQIARARLLYLSLNTKHPLLAKPQVRQAIKWAIDYTSIERNITPNFYTVHQTFLPAGFPAAVTDKPFQKNIARAKALLAEAGVPDGFEITLDHASSSPFSDIAQAIQADLAAVGIRVTLQSGEIRAVLTRTRNRQHDISLGRWGADYFDPNTNAQWFCENGDNSTDTPLRTGAWNSSWQDADIHARSKAAARELDTEKRIAMYAQLQRDMLERSPFVIMLQQLDTVVSQRRVSGIELGVMADRTPYRLITKS